MLCCAPTVPQFSSFPAAAGHLKCLQVRLHAVNECVTTNGTTIPWMLSYPWLLSATALCQARATTDPCFSLSLALPLCLPHRVILLYQELSMKKCPALKSLPASVLEWESLRELDVRAAKKQVGTWLGHSGSTGSRC